MPTVITILSSRKNHAWVSMEEIIVWIENSWMEWARERNIPCQLIMAEDAALSEVARHALSSNFIVVTCFNTSVASVLRGSREKLGIQVPWVYYLHGLASFGLWPLYHWEIGKLLTTNDIFIGSCKRDKDQFQLALQNVECQYSYLPVC